MPPEITELNSAGYWCLYDKDLLSLVNQLKRALKATGTDNLLNVTITQDAAYFEDEDGNVGWCATCVWSIDG